MKRRMIASVIWGMIVGIMVAAFIGCSTPYIPANTDKIIIVPQVHKMPVHVERHDYTA